jgi:hypothetical protein
MKSKRYILAVAIIIILSVVFVELYLQQSKVDGSTVESRELILNRSENGVHIVSEIQIDDDIISGIIGSNNKYGLAVFKSQANGKYKFQTRVLRESGRTIIEHTFVNNVAYDLFWRNQVDLDYAEIIYTVQGNELEPIKLDARDNQILYCEAPSNDYSVEVVYYDIQGNRYE